MKAAVIHGNKSQGARTQALGDFKAGRVTVLVATDIAARGLDIAQLPLVVNFDLPLVAEDYIHRVGRTGRAGLAGRAVSLVSPADRDLLRDIQRLLPAPIEQVADRRLPGHRFIARSAARKPAAVIRAAQPSRRQWSSIGFASRVRWIRTPPVATRSPLLTHRHCFVKLAVSHEPQRFVDADGGAVIGADVQSDRLDVRQLA